MAAAAEVAAAAAGPLPAQPILTKPTAALPGVISAPGPETLIEYRWPPGDAGEDYVIQEHLAAYIGATSFRRKYPELGRRSLEVEERLYLLHSGIITPSQEALGITVLKSDDAISLMAQHFPEKYDAYMKYVSEQKRLEMERSAAAGKADLAEAKQDKEKMAKLIREVIDDTVSWNKQFNDDRKRKRFAYFDLQTYNCHYPRSYPSPPKLASCDVSNAYPLALIPNQFTHHYRHYGAEELSYLPVKSVSHPPLGVLPVDDTSDPVFPDTSDEEEEAASAAGVVVNKTRSPRNQGSTRSPRGGGGDGSRRRSSPGAAAARRSAAIAIAAAKSPEPTAAAEPIVCGLCFKGSEENKMGRPENLIKCSQCDNAGHPTCLELNQTIVDVILTYPWQCMECKICTNCKDATDEENLLFCDNCDRGYHSYCVGIKEIPEGRWVCERCGLCVSCLTKTTGGKWCDEFTRPRDKAAADPPKFLQRHCDSCSKQFNKGNFCPVCLKVYDMAEIESSLLFCSECERNIHCYCDPKQEPDKSAVARTRTRANPYKCVLCRGEVEERMDSFHVRNKHDK